MGRKDRQSGRADGHRQDQRGAYSSVDSRGVRVYPPPSCGVLCLPRSRRDGTIISGDSLGMVKFWDSRTCTQLQTFKAHGADVLCMAIDPVRGL